MTLQHAVALAPGVGVVAAIFAMAMHLATLKPRFSDLH